jgi:FkbM family methyltransferase
MFTTLSTLLLTCPNKWTREFCDVMRPVQNKTFIDVGAAFGYEIDVAMQYGYSHLIGFECRFDEYHRLTKRYINNPKVSLIHACVSNTTGVWRFWRAEDSSSLIKDEIQHVRWKARRELKKTEIVPLVRLDDLQSEVNLDQIRLIKIDVQGYEPYVLSGASQLIHKYRPDLFYEISNMWKFEGAKLIHYVFGSMLGYSCRCKENCFCIWNPLVNLDLQKFQEHEVLA